MKYRKTSTRPAFLIVTLVAAFVSVARGQAADGWKAGAAKTVITPSESIWLAGFGSRTKPSAGVRQDIYVRAVALQHGSDKPSVLVTLDLVGIEREMADAMVEGARTQFGLTRDRLVLNISHTHSGPVVGLVLMPMYDLDPTQRELVRRQTTDVIEKTVRTIGDAIANMTAARVEFGQSLAGIAVNRRRVRLRGLPGPVDPDVPVLAIRTPDGALRVVVVGYAAHATALNDYLISGDWPGFAVAAIEKRHPSAMALFVQGCGADANPLPRKDEELARNYGNILAAAADEVLQGKMVALSGPLRTAFDLVELPFQTAPTREELQARLADRNVYVRLSARRLLEIMDREGKLPTTYSYPVQVWQFGRGLTFIALGGEVVVDYSLRLKKHYGFDRTWVAGYSNDILAYIPSRRVLEEGGYEAGDSSIYFGRTGAFTPAVEELIVKKVHELGDELGVVPASPR